MGCKLKGEKNICIYYLEGECFKSCANYEEDNNKKIKIVDSITNEDLLNYALKMLHSNKEQLKRDYKMYLKEKIKEKFKKDITD